MLLRKLNMKVVAAALAGLMIGGAFACQRGAEDQGSSVKANGVPVGDVRGTALVNKLIRTRLLDQTDPQSQTFQIEAIAGPEIESLKGLLGQFSEGGSQSEWRGGEPNPFGMLLWHQVIARFAEGLAGACATPTAASASFFNGSTVTLHPSYAAKLKAACAFEGDAEAKKQTVAKLWRATVGLAAAEEEAVFVEAFAGPQSAFASATGQERVEAMVLAMLLNPHFLLEK